MADKKISQLTSASTPLAGTEVLPIVQSGSTVKVASNDLTVKNVRSNATTGILQIAGPAAAATRVMTTPDANFTVARTDAAQNFVGNNTFDTTTLVVDSVNKNVGIGVASPQDVIDMARSVGGTVALRMASVGVGSITWRIASQYVGVSNAGFVIRDETAGANRIGINDVGDVKVESGNLVIGTAGKGIDFSANTAAAGMTSELLDWYEEGTWTPVCSRSTGGNITAVYDTQLGKYTRIGNLVTVSALIVITSVSAQGSGDNYVSGLPFTPADNSLGTGAVPRNDAFTTAVVNTCFSWGSGAVYFRENTNGTLGVAVDWKSGYCNFTVSYFV